MSFDQLSEPIRRYIRDKRWEQLRPIQIAAINRILSSDDNYILASRTASGKTEAAFLPILSKVDFTEGGVQVLYISPLIALINDQFYRVEELCKYLDIPVTKWHGESNRTLKEKLIKNPDGIVLITPESIEAMFVNKPFNLKQLFSNLKYVVIDEIHSFLGSDRGTQLKSLLSRLQAECDKPFSIVGLSATIGDYNEAKKFTGNEAHTKVLLDKTTKDINSVFRYFKEDGMELPSELLADLYQETKDNKVLIFPNSRGRAEEVAVKLKKISARSHGHSNYFSHHSSVDKEVREYVEYFAKNNKRQNFCISCTSTLELGIDIGSVEEVVQIDATHSIASLIQRLGRSGRKEGESSNLFLYATGKWSLLQSLACWLLYKEGFIEPPFANDRPYDILLHQALSIAKGHSGIAIDQLVKELKTNFAFNEIDISEIRQIVDYLIEINFLEKIQNEVIIGMDGERTVNSREFYSMFRTEENFKVASGGNRIGEIPLTPQIAPDQNILLSAKIWKIIDVDFKAKKIEVVPAKDGKKPVFYGGGSMIHQRIREKMLEVLYCDVQYDVLNEACAEEIAAMRKEFSKFKIGNIEQERPLLVSDHKVEYFTFTGTKVNRTIGMLFDYYEIKYEFNEYQSKFDLKISETDFLKMWKKLAEPLSNIDVFVEKQIEEKPFLLGFSKWGEYLPVKFKVELLKSKYYDLNQTKIYISKIVPIINSAELTEVN